eukprot:XP_011674529.1 PREDICTED: growth/differentiation factor 8-like [Strongylocentrotus purpuratus]
MTRRTCSRLGGSIVVFLAVVTLPRIGAAPRDITSSCIGCSSGTRRQDAGPTSRRNPLSSMSVLPPSASTSSSVSYSSSTALLSTTVLSPPAANSVAGENVGEPATNGPDQALLREEQINLVRDEILKKLHMVRPPTPEEVANANISEERMQEMYRLYYQSVQESNSAASQSTDEHHSSAYRDEVHSFRSTVWDWFSPRKLRIFLPVQFPQDKPRTVHNATLHLFVTPPGITGEETTTVVRIYQLLAPTRTGVRTPRRFVTSKEVSLTDSNWVSFTISEAVAMWMSDPTTNHGLELECDLVLTTHLFVSGYSSGRVPAHRTNHEDLRPRVDIIIREGREATLRRRRRSHRQSELDDAQPKCGQYQQSDECCRRRNLTISFRELRFNWILAPLEYNAHFCAGACTDFYNLADTNALIRTVIRLESQRSLPRPCCTPSKLGPLPVLYLHQLDFNKTEPRLYALPDMVIDSCGCS